MKQYTIGKKAAVIVLHQLCMILMVTGVFATGYAFRHDAHGNIDIYTLISLAGLVGSFVSLAYMANVAGRKSEDDYTIYYLPIDKVYSDVMLVIFTLLMVFMGKVISGVKNQHFDYASLIMTAGTFTFLFDLAFIILYQSIVRKIKGNILCTHSLMYKGYELLKRVIEKKDIHTQKTKEIMRIQEALEAISEGALDTTLNVNEFHGQQKKVAEAVNHIRQGLMSSVNESLTPFGYANFAPLITATLTVAIFLLSLFSLKKKGVLKALFVLSIITVVISLLPLMYGLNYYTLVGAFITVTLVIESILAKIQQK